MCTVCETVKSEQANGSAFGERLVGILNNAGTAMMISLGHRTGLFDALSRRADVTSEELADEAGLSERYVREWLGAMVCGRIVECDAGTRRYRLPSGYSGWLTRGAAPNNFAAVMQFVAVLGGAESAVADAFKTGKGVSYPVYQPRFDEVMAEESGQTVVSALDAHILPLVAGIQARLEGGIDVLDVGCGRGRAMTHLARRYPKSRFVGFDFQESTVAQARREAAGVTNVRFEARDAAAMGETRSFDFITTFDAIHDQARPADVLAGIRRALRRDGVYLCQEIRSEGDHVLDREHPLGAFLYTVSCMHCMSVSLANGGPGLGATWGRTLCARMLREAGFERVERHELPHDPLNDFYVCRA